MKPTSPPIASTIAARNSCPGKSLSAIQNDDPPDPGREGEDPRGDPDDHPRPLDRLRPEARQHVERHADQPEPGVARTAVAPLVGDVDLGHRGAGRDDERLRELLLADRAGQREQRVAAVRVERAPEVGDVGLRELAEHPIHELRGQPPPPAVVAVDAPAARDLGAAVHGVDEPHDVGRLVLEVGVHRHDDVAAGADDAGVHGRVLAEVPLEADRADVRIVRVDLLERLPRPVAEPSSTKMISQGRPSPASASAERR